MVAIARHESVWRRSLDLGDGDRRHWRGRHCCLMPLMPAGHPGSGKGFPSFKLLQMTVALLDECDTPRPNCRHARIGTTANAWRATAIDAVDLAVV